MEDKIRVLISEEDVNKRISEIAAHISKDYEGQPVHLICILKGGVFFTCELAKRLTIPVSLDFMSVSSYGAGKVSSGVVKIIKDLDEPLEDKHVLIVEDIIDSGRTLAYLMEILQQRKPKDLTVTLFVPLAGPVGGKLFCGGAALCICHGGIPPVAFSIGYHTKPYFSRAIYNIRRYAIDKHQFRMVNYTPM